VTGNPNNLSSATRRRRCLEISGAVFASAVLFYFATSLRPTWWLLWLAPVPLLWLAPQISRRAAFFAAFVAWFIGDLSQWDYFRHSIELPLLFITIVFGLRSLIFALGVLFARGFFRAGRLAAGAFAFPVYWVTLEYLTETASPDGTFGNLAYTQMNFLPVIQIASITGIWGISFIVFLFAGATAALLTGTGGKAQRRAVAVAAGGIVCATLIYGEWRARVAPSSSNRARITLLAKDVPIRTYLAEQSKQFELMREYAGELRRIPTGTTDAVVLPEKIGRFSEDALPAIDALFGAAAADAHCGILVGLVRQTPAGNFNEARFYSPHGKLQAQYDKHHLLPIERCNPGFARVVLDEPSGKVGA